MWGIILSKKLLHIEGLAVFVISIYFYAQVGESWWLFFVLLLLPDLSMLGYLVNTKIGSYIYNVFHTYLLPLLLIVGGEVLDNKTLLSIGIIWVAHIGMDRTVGYGIKYPEGFKETHLQKV